MGGGGGAVVERTCRGREVGCLLGARHWGKGACWPSHAAPWCLLSTSLLYPLQLPTSDCMHRGMLENPGGPL